MAVVEELRRGARRWRSPRTAQTRTLLAAAGVGALSGIRSTAGPTVLAHALERRGRVERFLAPQGEGTLERALTSDAADWLLPAMALGEVLVDKLPFIPDRTAPLPLLGRAAIGAAVGAVVGRRAGVGGLLPALTGAAAAIGAAALATAVRRRADELPLSSTALGFLEDGAVAVAGAALAGALE